MHKTFKKRVPGAIGETLSFLTTRPDAKKSRTGEYCDDCGARAKGKSHARVGKQFLCENCRKKHNNVWEGLSSRMGCGNCSNITSVSSKFSCKVCGRMLCGECGEYCKDHQPKEMEKNV